MIANRQILSKGKPKVSAPLGNQKASANKRGENDGSFQHIFDLPTKRIVIDLAGNAFPVVFVDRKSTRLNYSHVSISYAVSCLERQNWMTAQYNGVVY